MMLRASGLQQPHRHGAGTDGSMGGAGCSPDGGQTGSWIPAWEGADRMTVMETSTAVAG